jgi:hypothetical protein
VTDDEIEKNICRTLLLCRPLILIAILSLIVSLIIDVNYTGNEPYFWFQRSGAVMVLFAAWAEYKLSHIYNDINPPPSSYVAERRWGDKYGKEFKLISYAAVILIVAGTFIWGYGDIPFKSS